MSTTGANTTQSELPRRPLWVLAFFCALLAILAIGFVSYTEMSVLANSSARVQRSYDVLQTLHDLNTSLTDTETNQRGFLLTQDTTYLDQYDAAVWARSQGPALRRLGPTRALEDDHLCGCAAPPSINRADGD